MNRLIVIADIIASRDIADRAAVQRDLNEALGSLNRQTDGLLSPYTITLGDEFQAVLSTAGRVFTDMLAIRAAVYPVRLRFAVSIGPMATPINRSPWPRYRWITMAAFCGAKFFSLTMGNRFLSTCPIRRLWITGVF